jgi:hypothetical protein
MSTATVPPAPAATPDAPAAPLSVEAIVAHATPEQRRELVQRLVFLSMDQTNSMPQAITGPNGDLIGVFVPNFESTSSELLTLTPEDVAEHERRFDSPEGWLTPEEFIKSVEEEYSKRNSQ